MRALPHGDRSDRVGLVRSEMDGAYTGSPRQRINQGLESLVLILCSTGLTIPALSALLPTKKKKRRKERKSVTIITNHCSASTSNQNHHRARPIFRRSIGAVVPRKSEVAGAGCWRGNNVTDSGCKVGLVAGRQGKQSGTNLNPVWPFVCSGVGFDADASRQSGCKNHLLRHSAFSLRVNDDEG